MRGLPSALFGSAISRRASLTEWDASIRGILPAARRIGFVSLSPRVGTSTLATHMVRLLAGRRTDPVLAVDVAGGSADLAARLQVPPTRADATRAGARTTADALTGLTAGPGWYGLHPSVADGPVPTWLAEAAPITRFFDVTVTDFGARHPRVDLAACAALSDVVCLVGDSRRSAAELLRAVAPAVAALPETPQPVLVLVDRSGRGRTIARAMQDDPRPVIRIPRDAGLRAGGPPRAHATNQALLRLAATLVSGRKAVAP